MSGRDVAFGSGNSLTPAHQVRVQESAERPEGFGVVVGREKRHDPLVGLPEHEEELAAYLVRQGVPRVEGHGPVGERQGLVDVAARLGVERHGQPRLGPVRGGPEQVVRQHVQVGRLAALPQQHRVPEAREE